MSTRKENGRGFANRKRRIRTRWETIRGPWSADLLDNLRIAAIDALNGAGFDFTPRKSNRKEAEAPPFMEIVAGLLERKQEVLVSI
ncbi:hypothetical protein [Methylacidimicrobium sp. B4]|uniref:hypothetical protein n=1 Tax=Methylacidimicrobium sp. B4 TaxID=2796139 RepID=UPI001A8CF72C|nr:hypothetical protein [Methylacidimicrobium sp. B4]QSR84674.1 hypothetical protein MacB4_10865 [Methylacidimicrobium sp. B4]